MSGPAGIQYPLVVCFEQSAAGITNNDYVMTRAGRILDFWTDGRAGAGGETMQLLRVRAAVPAAISDAVAYAAANTIYRAANIINAAGEYNIIAGDSLRFAAAGAATVDGEAFALLLPGVSNPVTL